MSDTAFLVWSSASRTHVGNVRRLNEDACLDCPELGLWVVADGMGGHSAGDYASQLIVSGLADMAPPADLGSFINEVRTRLHTVNRVLLAETQRRRVDAIGSTVVALLAFGRRYACLWAGDSRAYLYRRGELSAATRDHTMVEEYVQSGLMSPAEAASAVDANVITRAVGVEPCMALDAATELLRPGDTFVLCSDGLYKELSEADIAATCATGTSDEICAALMDTALTRGARDNVTVIVVQFRNAFTSD
ncbi:MAG TPA: protein phosphatase 2C domain-containing protein [Gammaproteobacteria bacterium]|nr:protein phosphatase 2C domain-containing protein [Gammaproteobacteria bacterium]